MRNEIAIIFEALQIKSNSLKLCSQRPISSSLEDEEDEDDDKFEDDSESESESIDSVEEVESLSS